MRGKEGHICLGHIHPPHLHPSGYDLSWKQFSQTNICRCPENSATSFFCPLPSCYTAIRPDIICTIAPCWQCIESEMGVFWELMLHWCPVAMGPQLWHEVMTFLFGHIVTYWVDTNYPDSLSTNLAAGSGQGSHSPIHGMAFEVTTTLWDFNAYPHAVGWEVGGGGEMFPDNEHHCFPPSKHLLQKDLPLPILSLLWLPTLDMLFPVDINVY